MALESRHCLFSRATATLPRIVTAEASDLDLFGAGRAASERKRGVSEREEEKSCCAPRATVPHRRRTAAAPPRGSSAQVGIAFQERNKDAPLSDYLIGGCNGSVAACHCGWAGHTPAASLPRQRVRSTYGRRPSGRGAKLRPRSLRGRDVVNERVHRQARPVVDSHHRPLVIHRLDAQNTRLLRDGCRQHQLRCIRA